MVPPRGRMPETFSSVSSKAFSGQMRPSKPSGMPMTFQPWLRMAAFVAARMTALRPGASPPPVAMPMHLMSDMNSLVVFRCRRCWYFVRLTGPSLRSYRRDRWGEQRYHRAWRMGWPLFRAEVKIPTSHGQNPYFSQKTREMGHPGWRRAKGNAENTPQDSNYSPFSNIRECDVLLAMYHRRSSTIRAFC